MTTASARSSATTPQRHDVIVVGGGLAGLTAAVTAARAGSSVTLLEARTEPGGRARTLDHHGFLFNEGAHALYRGGAGWRVLTAIGLSPSGKMPSLTSTRLLEHGELISMRRVMSTRRALSTMRRAVSRGEARRFDGRSLAEWLDTIEDAELRSRVAVLFRVSSYLDDPEHVDAGASLDQARRAARGVLYLHGGWAQLVDGLRAAAGESGVVFETATKADGIMFDRDDVVITAGGRNYVGRSVVVASGGPGHAQHLLGDRSPTLAHRATSAVPVVAACLDVALDTLPRPSSSIVFGVDEPIYLTVHSIPARLAPPGAALIHLLRYAPDLDFGAQADGSTHRTQLEALLDRAQPGWRDHLVEARFSRRLVVAHDRPQPGGPAPGITVPECPTVFVAGDWLTSGAMLGDAALVSGRQAGLAAARVASAGTRTAPASG